MYDAARDRYLVSNNGDGKIIQVSNTINSNIIGADRTGTTHLGNEYDGVAITFEAHSNTIGGTETGYGNLIAFNERNGVFVEHDSTLFLKVVVFYKKHGQKNK